jgi:site-specific DNA-methyltransferase (adenine-specific)
MYNGDCLRIMPNLPDECANIILTDPPYGIDFQSAWPTEKSKRKPKIKNDKHPFIWFLHDAFRLCKSDGGCVLCFTRDDVCEIFKTAIQCAGFTIKSVIVWDKQVHGMGNLKSQFAPQHELIIFATKGKYQFPDKRPHDVISIQRISPSNLLHPNEKPIELLEYLVKSTCKVGDTVIDMFMGSGSTGVACINTGRNFIGIELDEHYFNIAKDRINIAYNEEYQSEV